VDLERGPLGGRLVNRDVPAVAVSVLHRLRVPSDARGAERIRLRGAEARYLRDVLRLRRGARLEVFDGEGGQFIAEVADVGRSGVELAVVAVSERSPAESPLSLTLAVAVAKGAKLDWVVEKATELGVSRIVPFTCARTIPQGDFASRTRRWQRLAEAAATQSRRAVCPDVDDVAPFSAVLELAPQRDRAILFWERGDASIDSRSDRSVATAVVVTGPEGGFTDEEATAARSAGFTIATLGPRILRAETAALTAVALAQNRWGDLRK
jgi:16S rRNA (uracil1498-N3)-methyltransferase